MSMFLADLAGLVVIICVYLALFTFTSVVGTAAYLKLREVYRRGR